MKIIIACEESQVVAVAFRKKGHEAYSCDIQKCSGRHPEWHIQGDILKHLEGDWDMMIAHPPCTFLSRAGAGWLKRRPERKTQMIKAANFFKKIWQANISKICVENPVIYIEAKEIIGSNYHQIVEPYQFGEPYLKKTCLWLKGLPKLKPTNIVTPHTYWVNSSSNYRGRKLTNEGLCRNPKNRSKTFKGIANAMAEQWG